MNHTHFKKGVLGLVGILAILFSSYASMAQNKFEKWNIDFDREVEWIKVTDAGILLVAAKGEGLYGIDPSNGETLWEFQEVKNLPEDLVEIITNSNYIIVYGRGLKTGQAYCIDATTGEVKFNTKDKFQVGLSGGVTPIYQTESLLLVAGDRFLNINPETGEVLWDVSGFVSGGDKRILGPQTFGLRTDKKNSIQSIKGNQPFLFDSKETFIAHLAKGHIAKYNVKTGERLWTFDFKGNKIKMKDDVPVSALNNGFAQMQLDFERNRLYLPIGNKLMAVDTKTGGLVWFSEKKSLKGKPVDMVLTDSGILVMFTGKKTGVNIVDYDTGEPVWEDPVKLKYAGPFAVADGKVYAINGKSVLKIDETSGTSEIVTKKGVKFGGDEDPTDIVSYKDELILSSAQNVMGVDKEGGVGFHTYLKPNTESGLAKFAKIATAVALSAMSAASAHQRAASTGRDQTYQTYSFPTQRFQNSKDRGWFKYITTKVEEGDEKGFGVARVDKRDGEIVKQIVLGERKLTYEIDEIDHLLYSLDGKKTIVCYEF